MKLSNGKEIVLKEITRGVIKGYTKMLFGENAEISANTEDMKMNPNNAADAQDWKISQLSGLTVKEVEALSLKDYEVLEKAVNKLESNPS